MQTQELTLQTKKNNLGRSARLDVRMPPQTRELVERAADLQGMSLTQFTESAMIEKANTVIAQHEKTVLTRRDQERFLALMEEDNKPNDALAQAIDKYLASDLGRAANQTF
jgi:uncharacterized protein (DUF1778 family)